MLPSYRYIGQSCCASSPTPRYSLGYLCSHQSQDTFISAICASLQHIQSPLTSSSTTCLLQLTPTQPSSVVKNTGNSSTPECSYSPSFTLSLLLATACIRPIVPHELLTVCFRKYTLELISWSFIFSVCCFLKFSCCKHVIISNISL